MTITTEFRLESPSLPLLDVAESVRSTELTCVHGLQLRDGVQLFLVQIDSTDDVSETELTTLENVRAATLVGHTSDEAIYKIIVELEERLTRLFDPERFDIAPVEPPTISPNGWYEHKIFKSYAEFNDYRTYCQERDVGVELVSVSPDPSAIEDPSRHGLTERQHEALTLALARGYYDSPRRTSTEDLAHELGISQPSMSSLLRRGERQLLSSALDSRKEGRIRSGGE
ncbi:helix-turn-helix domain-containing protein [Natrinema altunense]|uniref:Bacterio-opsin activator n=1 Tax=Natrinema altunense TaxID=222984 RepID=A0A482XZX2_9EURY|nr:helix-turn-helix domain-containing protein [Natrinema altunense]RZH69281.1 bacterio-opsin activator [Natrinema altunense]